MPEIELHIIPAGDLATNAYLLLARQQKQAVLIDAPDGVWAEVGPRLEAAGATLTELWLTHGHFDHMMGVPEVVRVTGARVRAHRDDAVLLAEPERMTAFLGLPYVIEPVQVDAWLTQGEKLQALGMEFEVRHVPGHCPGNVLFYAPALGAGGAAFVGDSLFAGGVGRSDLPGGDFDLLARSIREQIYTLPGGTAVFPGHGGPTTVAAEAKGNPYVPLRK